MLKINSPHGNVLPKYFHLEASVLQFLFFILITHGGYGAGEWRKDDFPQANFLQAFLAPQGTISPFTGKGKNTVTILSGIHLSACKVLTNKIKGPCPINQYQCINKFMSAFRKHTLRIQGLAWPCIT